MPTLKGTEVSLSCVQCFLYLASSSINVSFFYFTWLDTFPIMNSYSYNVGHSFLLELIYTGEFCTATETQ